MAQIIIESIPDDLPTNQTPIVEIILIYGSAYRVDDANQTLDNSSTHCHDEPRSEDGDPLKNPEQRTQKTILITLPITIQKNR